MSEPDRTPLNDAPEPREEASAAQQLTADEPLEDSPAGGGMGGTSAAEGAPGAATRPDQAATPSNPNSPAVAGDAASLRAEQEARHLSTEDAAEPRPLPGGM